MLTLFAFIVALAVLIAVHEYGHYRVAVACGVKVLRFSIGFGKPLFTWKSRHSGTEFVIAALPLGGYVRMLDEREAEVPVDQLHRSFNRQSLKKRAAIVAAGPAANLLLAVVLYSLVNWIGIEQPRAIISAPASGTLAAEAGLKGGEHVQSVQIEDSPAVTVESFEDLRWQLTQAALNGKNATIQWVGRNGASTGHSFLKLSELSGNELDQSALARIGIQIPWTSALIGELMPNMPAQKAGLKPGDVVLAVNNQEVVDGAQLRFIIRQAGGNAAPALQTWRVQREAQTLSLQVQPDIVVAPEGAIGRIGAYIGGAPETVLIQKGVLDGLAAGIAKTWEISVLSVQMMAKMLIGQASLQNLSGPLTIADYAGKSASLGVVQYILFLALISVSLGVLNLLPLPVLDGGHLMYYLWEGVTGHPVSEAWMDRLQRVGIGLLLVMMSIALFNDIGRIWG
ncbi:MAG: RIP metalloprotease RseP [Comamonadaceae bacterium]|nr:RIP metalloprotease RseP [Comamonadaceae bacterium]